jgi:hypothetical protein
VIARDFSRRAIDSAQRAEEKEVAAGYQADASLREALFGNLAEASQRAIAALALSHGRDVHIRAQLALNRNDSLKAVEALQVAGPYELGIGSTINSSLYPVYVHGEAYLAAHQGNEAAVEFQKILDHRGIVINELIGALAHLQIGRAYAMRADTTKAKAAYQDFLTLWKDADPDIPILKQAKAEYAKLQ